MGGPVPPPATVPGSEVAATGRAAPSPNSTPAPMAEPARLSTGGTCRPGTPRRSRQGPGADRRVQVGPGCRTCTPWRRRRLPVRNSCGIWLVSITLPASRTSSRGAVSCRRRCGAGGRAHPSCPSAASAVRSACAGTHPCGVWSGRGVRPDTCRCRAVRSRRDAAVRQRCRRPACGLARTAGRHSRRGTRTVRCGRQTAGERRVLCPNKPARSRKAIHDHRGV